jgi:hypothetical protein
MTPLGADDPEFLQDVERLLGAGELLVVVKRAFGGGQRDFLFFNSMSEFHGLLGRLRHRDCVVVMKSFRKVIEGQVDAALIDAAQAAYREGACWILLDKNPPRHQASYFPAECRGDLLEELGELIGRDVLIIEEPKYASEADSLRAYVPDENGSVRPAPY